MDHMIRGESTCTCGYGITGGTSSNFSTLGHDVRPSNAVDCSVDTSTACQLGIRGVHDGISNCRSDITFAKTETAVLDVCLHRPMPARC
jgi:hypothetical protein